MKRRFTSVIFLLSIASLLGMQLTAAPNDDKDKAQSRLRTLAGQVRGSQDEPLSKAIVYLKNTKTLAMKTYITESDGSYHFPVLAPNADYEVYAEFEGNRSDTKTLSAFDNRKQLNVTLRIRTVR